MTTKTTKTTLSRGFAASLYRWRSGMPRPHYAQVKGRDRCDECVARAHEQYATSGALAGARSSVRERRTLTAPDATRTLLLCGAHAELWRERDAADGAPAGRLR